MCAIKPLLGDYLDRELSTAESRRVESHLGECPGCRAELDELKSLSNMIGGLPQAALPSGFFDRLERRRAGAPAPRAPRPSRSALSGPFPWKSVAFAAASLLAGLIVYDRLRVALPVESSPTETAGEAALPLAAPAPVLQTAALGKTAVKGKLARAPGAPIGGEASAPATDQAQAQATNEELERDLERQKRLMGLREVADPERHPMGEAAFIGATAQNLAAPLAPAMVGGSIAGLLAPAGRAAVVGDGAVVRSEDEQARLWAARKIALAPPLVDYQTQMLVVVFAAAGSAVEVSQVLVGADETVVRYRRLAPAPGAASAPVQVQVIPRTDNPVAFQLLP